MRRPKLHFTVRRMMVAVAVIALCCTFVGWLYPEYVEDTVYAKGYSESKFLNIRIGMTMQQVEAVMGIPPMGKNSGVGGSDAELWQYSYSPRDGDYWRRWVWFKDGEVCRIDCLFYLD